MLKAFRPAMLQYTLKLASSVPSELEIISHVDRGSS